MADSRDTNIAGALHGVAARQPDRLALVTGTGGRYRQWSFRELLAAANRYSLTLRKHGVRPGERVMLMVPPSREFIGLTFGLFQLGAVVILIDPGMGYKNLLRCIGSVRPDVLISIPPVQIMSRLFGKVFRTVRTRFCVGPSLGLLGINLAAAGRRMQEEFSPIPTRPDDLAAIIFTTGSTGPPKGVQYTHGIFSSQLELIRDFYNIGPGDVDQPGFPLFALFSTALGATAVIPDMDPTRPAQVDPARFVRSLVDWKVSYSFGSPAIWKVVSRYCLEKQITLPVNKVLMAGAPVSGELVSRVRKCLPLGGEIYTPYGATECLPVASISGREILDTTWHLSRTGKGTCVGKPLPGMEIAIIEPLDMPLASWDAAKPLSMGEIGEIVVKGPVVTRRYDHNEQETRMAKVADGAGFRHRMGDMGYLDEQGRLWFCGRKAHRVLIRDGVMYSVCCEAVFNEHPKVMRSALVGIGKPGSQQPILIVELEDGGGKTEKLFRELRELAAANALTRSISTFLVHPGFPVDIRHNAKIFREKLAQWADDRLKARGCLDEAL